MGIVGLGFLLALQGPLLEVPWKCGDTRPCTQAHGGFSHTGDNYWAWDFDFTVGDEVLSASSGTVSHIEMSQPEGGCDPSFAALANYVVVDHGDGTSVGYTHLLGSSSPLQVGDEVVPGMLIARVGLSGYVCGDHLHFQVQSTCGSSFCASVQGEFADYGDPAQGESIQSTNCPVCTLELDGGTTVISELDPGCFTRETSYWWSTLEGDDDHHFYTIASDAAEPESFGTWSFVVTTPGEYRVEVFVPEQNADAQGAQYQVHHAAGSDAVPIDQSTNKGWQDLGTFDFTGGPDERIELADNTGEALDLQRHLAFDAIRLTYVPTTGETTDTADPSTSTGGPSTSDTTDDPTTAGSTPATTDDPAGTTDDPVGTSDTGSLPGTAGERQDDSGCACTVEGHDPGSRWSWLLLPLWSRRRRRVLATR